MEKGRGGSGLLEANIAVKLVILVDGDSLISFIPIFELLGVKPRVTKEIVK